MSLKIKIIFLFFLTLFLGLSSPKNAYAETFQLSGKITDSTNNAISGAAVDVVDSITHINAGTVISDGSGNYNVFVLGGTYDVKVTPPAGSGYSKVVPFVNTVNC
jgi:hypothetical protein